MQRSSAWGSSFVRKKPILFHSDRQRWQMWNSSSAFRKFAPICVAATSVYFMQLPVAPDSNGCDSCRLNFGAVADEKFHSYELFPSRSEWNNTKANCFCERSARFCCKPGILVFICSSASNHTRYQNSSASGRPLVDARRFLSVFTYFRPGCRLCLSPYKLLFCCYAVLGVFLFYISCL